MAQPKDHLSDLDRHVQLLEGKVNQLRASLNHWQQWYLEYSALKEEVDQLPKDPQPRKELARIRRDFDSQLLTKKEINEIFGKNDLRDIQQILTVLSRRTDYVEQNIASLTKLLEAEENRLSAATVVAHPDGGTDEETGLPITDIIEQLDEDGNVTEFRLQTGADAGSKVVAALEKTGIHELSETEAESIKTTGSSGAGAQEKVKVDPGPVSYRAGEVAAEPPSSQSARKSVSFADDTKAGHEPTEPPISKAAQKVEELMRQARAQEAMDMSTAVIPNNESPVDSAMRREMLDYCMSEIGPVVAELQLEEDGFEEDDWDMTEEDTEDDDEDELGRSKRSVVTDDYIKRMQELEKRLQGQSAFAVRRPQPDSHTAEEGVGQVRVVTEPDSSASLSEKLPAAPQEAKAVRFAPALDIAEEKSTSTAKPPKPVVNPIGDIVEKSLASEPMEEEADVPPKRVSRFKKERAAVSATPGSSTASSPLGPLQIRSSFFSEPPATAEPVEPAPPEGQTLANAIVERNVSSEPTGPDDMDDVLLYQAASVEYNRLRNKMIQQQGGFLKEEESPVIPLEEEEGGPPRMSRFKAARLAKK